MFTTKGDIMVNGRQSGKNRNPQYQNIEHKPVVKKRHQGKCVRKPKQNSQH
ncbi:MAG: hypothetical protein LR008_02020 [Candidatus Pacebacteria bacterium]|nr:hypothetical protein [Candidatus Paceibacterota bacterium]